MANNSQPSDEVSRRDELDLLRQQATDSERRLREETYLNSALLRAILHDLKNPMTVTLGNLQVVRMLATDALSDKTRRLLEAAEEGCIAQLNIINNLSDLLKLEMGTLFVQPVRINPSPEIDEQVRAVNRFDSKKAYLYTPPAESLTVTVERDSLPRMIRNILQNSMRYTRNNGRIEVSLYRSEIEPKMASVRFQDDGEPISAEMRDLIFDRRSQTLSEIPGRRGDVGMGLTFSRAIARAIGGDLKAIECDKGACFELTLPLARED